MSLHVEEAGTLRLPEVGRRTADAGASIGARLRVLPDNSEDFENVDPTDDAVPALISGRLLEDPGARRVAISLNGRVVAVVPVSEIGDETRFVALVPARRLRAGANAVQVNAYAP